MKIFKKYLGTWRGKGISFGEEITGTLRIYNKCQGDFVVFEEVLFESNGSVHYEDCAWIHQQPSEDEQHFVGYHFTPGGNVQRFLVVQKEDFHNQFHWWAGPLVPVVYYQMYEEKLDITVLDVQQMMVHQMKYERV